MKQAPGYPLPSGELGSDDIVCQLVYLPDRPEYWQAFYAALHYMTTWRAWERDDDKRGKDAAANWRAAFELTSECWRMACLQELQDDVAEILAIMQLGNACCDEQDITDGDRYTDRVEDGVGDVPQNIIDAGYADDAADWDGFDDYKCMIVHVTVNQLEARLREIDDVVERAGPYLAVAAALSAILGVIVATGGLAIVFGILAGIGTVSALYYALIGFGSIGDLADKVDTNHDELACAMYYADGDESALVALNDKIDELFTAPEALILKNMNLGPTLKALYAGRYDQQDIAEILSDAGYDLGDFNCLCIEQIGEYLLHSTWPVDDVWDSWSHDATADIRNDGIAPYCTEHTYNGGFLRMYVNTLGSLLGLDDLPNRHYRIRKLTFNTKNMAANAGKPSIGMNYQGGGSIYFEFANTLVWTEYDTDLIAQFDDPGYHLINGGWIQFFPKDGIGNNTRFDNVTIDFDSYTT